MKLTDRTRDLLRCRRARRQLAELGYEEVGERGGKLWELHRGFRQDHKIIDVVVAPEGRTIFIKTAVD
jgi:hypothetical protein